MGEFEGFPIVDPRGVAKFEPMGMIGTILCREPLAVATCQISKLLAMCFQRRFLNFFPIKTYMLPWQPEFQSDLPKNNKQHFLLLSNAVCVLINISLLAFEILMFSYSKSIDPWVIAEFDPRGMSGTIYVEGH